MTPNRAANEREAELVRRFGEHALAGQTEAEQRGLYIGAVATVIFTGSPQCYSLADTAETGGC